jgi:uncharacterized protein (DUF1330 family)
MNNLSRFAITFVVGSIIGVSVNEMLHAQSKPPAYIVTEFDVIDDAAFKEFGEKVTEVNKASGVKYIIRRGNIIPIEGAAPQRLTVQAFANLQDAIDFQASKPWVELLPLRAKALKARSFIAEGVSN